MMPWTAAAAGIGLAAMAGLPLTTGFLSKELLLKAAFDFQVTSPVWGGWVLGAVVFAAILKVTIAWRFFRFAFLGAASPSVTAHWHAPSFALQVAPVGLAAATLGFGIAAGSFGRLGDLFAITGVHAAPATLYLWHGVTRELLMSVGIVALGMALYALLNRRGWSSVPVPTAPATCLRSFSTLFLSSMTVWNASFKPLTAAFAAGVWSNSPARTAVMARISSSAAS